MHTPTRVRPVSFLAWLILVAAPLLALSLGHVRAADPPGVSPTSVTAFLTPGQSTTISKSVATAAIPPTPAIVLLSDTTGSMGPAIANVQSNIGTIVSSVLSSQPTALFDVADYKDGDPISCPVDPYAFRFDLGSFTGTASTVATGVNAWSASGGCDAAESDLNALDQIAKTAPFPASASSKIVVWFGDAASHDPAPAGADPAHCCDLGVTEATATADLVAAGVHVIAVCVNTSGTSVTDDCILPFGLLGLNGFGQASRITAATGGVLVKADTPADVSAAILKGLTSLPVSVTPTTLPGCDPNLSLSWTPASQTMISVATGAPSGVLTCTVSFLINGKDAGSAFHESISITVYTFAPGGGAFVIGDKNSAIGTNVTFWGAQWWKLNALSGGSAPAAFKGFADQPATPSCGTNWSTDPGNSPPPPNGPLPAYMGVIVSSSISQSGSTISGNTPSIVVVKTAPGYQPDPGNAGTGTVVATICKP